MSRKNNKRYTKAQIQARIEAKKKAKRLAMQKHITIFTLLALLIIGLVSTTFASFTTPAQTGNGGSLVAQIKTNAVNNGNKDHIAPVGADVDNADTSANVDVADTSATISTGTVLHFKPSSNWTESGAWYACYFYGNGEAWVKCHDSDGDGIYTCVSPSGDFTKCIFTRMNPSNTSLGWDAKWNQTGNLVYDGNNRLFTNPDDSWNDATTTWSSFDLALVGAFNNWDHTTDLFTTNSIKKTLAQGSYDFKLRFTNDKWLGNNGDIENTTATGWSFKESENDCTLKAKGGHYTFTYDPDGNKISVSAEGFSYTATAGVGGTITNGASGKAFTSDGADITATAYAGYKFKKWQVTDGSVVDENSASTTIKPTADGAVATANFVPVKPQSVTLTPANTATGTSGNGSQSKPYIVYYGSGFNLTANATLVSGATDDISARYSITENGTYGTTNSFYPTLETKGTDQTFTVYAKAFANDLYSDDSVNDTAYYMVFSHLDETKTEFEVSSNTITNVDTLTLSGANIDGVDEAERAYIDYTYQVRADGDSTYQDISGNTWSTETLGTYHFRVKVHNSKTNETVYGTYTQRVVVKLSEVNITVTNDNTAVSPNVIVSADGTPVTGNKIPGNSQVKISITRPSKDYYIQYLKVNGTSVKAFENYNGDISDYIAIAQAKTDVTINYKLVEKPKVTIAKPNNSDSINFKYFVDGTESTVTAADTYIVDYNSKITYSVTPSADYYVKFMTGVTMGSATSGTATGTATVTSSISSVTAQLVKNNTITVNVDSTSAVTTGGLISVDNSAYTFGEQIPLNYGVASTVVITPPENCYAVVSGNSVSATIGTDGKATFNVTLTGADKVYTVKFIENPKIFMKQPQYGSVYITSGSDSDTRYYFNGDYVGYGTELTVHTMVDNNKQVNNNAAFNSCTINSVKYTPAGKTAVNLGTNSSHTFTIRETSTVEAEISMNEKYVFDSITAYGKRRIFFTDNNNWGSGNVSVHCSDTSSVSNLTAANSITMKQKYKNEADQYVFYADIPYNTKFVTFFNNSATSKKTDTVAVSNETNAFWNDNYICTPWNMIYSDYIATDRETSIQQATTSKGKAAVFEYSCDYGDDTLSAEIVSGNETDADVEFNKGKLSITPKSNELPHILVKVTSAASTTVKYYLIRVENFGISSFTGLQKIYDSAVLNNIQLSLIVEGGVLDYFAQYFISDSNVSGSYQALGDRVTIQKDDTLQSYINTFVISYEIGSKSGVKYYKGEATDGANRKASATQKTLFGTNSYKGERALYFYNDTTVNMNKYNLRACFSDGDNRKFVTMNQVGSTNYYQATIPKDAGSTVNFYLCNPDTFSNIFEDFDGTNDNAELYSYSVRDVNIPEVDKTNVVYKATSIADGSITGSFVEFD